MSWRIELADHPIHAAHLLGGDPAQLAVWTSKHDVHFYAERTGAWYGNLNVAPTSDTHPSSEAGRRFLETLRAPNGTYLPVVAVGHRVIHTTNDGRLRVHHEHDHRLVLEMDGHQTVLLREGDVPLVAVGLDRELGIVGALSADGRLHVYQQHVYVGAFSTQVDFAAGEPTVLLPDATGTILVMGATQIQALDTTGQVQHRIVAPVPIGAAACSPDGNHIVVGDRDQGIIRVYDAQLRPVRQQAALELWSQAVPLQLLSTRPTPDGSPEAVDVANDGTLLLALDGIVCLTHVSELTPMPQSRPLW